MKRRLVYKLIRILDNMDIRKFRYWGSKIIRLSDCETGRQRVGDWDSDRLEDFPVARP